MFNMRVKKQERAVVWGRICLGSAGSSVAGRPTKKASFRIEKGLTIVEILKVGTDLVLVGLRR